MRKENVREKFLLGILFSLTLILSCGGGSKGTGTEISVSDLPVRVQQDVICYARQLDYNTGSVSLVEDIPKPRSITFNLNYSELCPSTFAPKNQTLIFDSCFVSVSPISNLPAELKSIDFLKEMADMISCTADDISPKGSAVAKISLSNTLVDMMKFEYLKYPNYAPFFYRIFVTFRFSSTCSDGPVERTVSVPVEFSNFIENQNDLCQQ